jgi:hypothetical protein
MYNASLHTLMISFSTDAMVKRQMWASSELRHRADEQLAVSWSQLALQLTCLTNESAIWHT